MFKLIWLNPETVFESDGQTAHDTKSFSTEPPLGSSVGTVRHLELYLSQRLIDKYVLNLMCILIDMMIIALKFYKYSCFIKLAFKILKRNGFVISLN